MRKIKLTQGKYALVDDIDFEWLNQRKWWADKIGKYWYAVRRSWNPTHKIYIHREILGLQKGDELEADHINHNTLNNKRCNLRAVTHQQNAINNLGKGIHWHKQIKRWIAGIKIDRRLVYLGCFTKKSDAKRARAKVAQARQQQMNLI